MANPEHLQILKQGVKAWNQWRQDNSDVTPDLVGAGLREAKLMGAHLRGAVLSRANLRGAGVHGANLCGADLFEANLMGAKLVGANLSGANLYFEADLAGADLTKADLRLADLRHTGLIFTSFMKGNLAGADLARATMASTDFCGADLTACKGLEEIRFGTGPVFIDPLTLLRTETELPETLLEAAGWPREWIESQGVLRASPISYDRVFISYSVKDQDVADKIYFDLRKNGVDSFVAGHDLRPGDRFVDRIFTELGLRDRTIVVLSENSVKSDWVEDEVNAAIEKESKDRVVLYPIRIDDAVLASDAPAWCGQLRRKRHIGDWTRRKDTYDELFAALLHDLEVRRELSHD